MAVRVIAVLLAVAVAAGIAVPTALTSRDVASQVGDSFFGEGSLEEQPALVAWPVALDPPRAEPKPAVGPPADSHGRLHQVRVFRPPCGIAPR